MGCAPSALLPAIAYSSPITSQAHSPILGGKSRSTLGFGALLASPQAFLVWAGNQPRFPRRLLPAHRPRRYPGRLLRRQLCYRLRLDTALLYRLLDSDHALALFAAPDKRRADHSSLSRRA